MQSQVKRRIAFGITTGGLLAGGGLGFAHADSAGAGSGTTGTTAGGSPGVLSGNSIQIPVDIPINVCGVTANVLGVLNPAAGNSCVNEGGATAGPGGSTGSTANGGSTATGGAQGSPGVLSGNNVQIPVTAPVNVCGDTVNVIGVGNAAKDNHCRNTGGSTGTGGSGATATGGAQGSPGVLSGNNVQIPVTAPVNVCGDTVSVVGVKNDAKDNHCRNTGGSGATATGGAQGSPGILSGNNVQIPIDIPVNVCGDSVSVVGVGDSAGGNSCKNGAPATPPTTSTPPPSIPVPPATVPPETPGTATSPATAGEAAPPAATGSLAHTGADGLMLAPVGAALIGGGAFLYRKFKPSRTH